ncbi:MAG: copper resistance protein CopC [Herminiimonas sp.]|nr:copper resistance protein CopC [Herminiimonas sp.]
MKASQRYILFTLFAATTVAGNTSTWAHATLKNATPAKDVEVTNVPKEITLQFSEKLEAAFSSAKLVDSTGKELTADKATLDADDPSVMKLAVPALTAGTYTVVYVGVGHDGHRRKGDYSFTVK